MNMGWKGLWDRFGANGVRGLSRPFAPLHRMVAGGRVGPLHQYHDHVSRGQKGAKLPRRRVDFSCLSEFILFFYGFAIKFVGLWLK